jgi:hypothetical protein
MATRVVGAGEACKLNDGLRWKNITKKWNVIALVYPSSDGFRRLTPFITTI